VWYPQFPNPTEPKPAEWQQLLVHESQQMDELAAHAQGGGTQPGGSPLGEKIAVTHSLGCINFLIAARANKFDSPFDRVVFVAPPDPQLLQPIEGAVIDLADGEWFEALKRHTRSFTLIASDEDKWLPRGIHDTYIAHWPEVTPVIVPGAKHFSLDDGWGPWTGLANWLTSPNQPLALLQSR
jgi:predicted alpha/beta hydrolase family esterase